ncbi:MAG: zinc ribbon domain-containing protein [Phycisphaerae bacterium]
MPIYEYDCKNCQKPFEALVRSAGEERTVTCPACGGRRIERRPSVFAAHAATRSNPLPRAQGGCGRCGDPNGPCGLD